MSALPDALTCGNGMHSDVKPVQPADGILIRMSADVVFHRDVLRPALTGRTTRGSAGRLATTDQLSLDIDDEW